MDVPCVHCGQHKQAKNGGARHLCYGCYRDLATRRQYPRQELEDNTTLEELERTIAEQMATMPEEKGMQEPRKLTRLQRKALWLGIELEVEIT